MDYHVFILSRIREGYDTGMSTEQAISHGIKTTAGVVTSAAIVMVAVFAIFGALQAMLFKQFGVGLASAILIDATIVRGDPPAGVDEAARRLELVPAEVARVAAALRARREARAGRSSGRPDNDRLVATVAQPATKSRRAAAAAAALLTEVGLARVALGIGALHVVDDNFLQPQPGTSAGDHLLGGLDPDRVLRPRRLGLPAPSAGSRGTLAIFVGLFMVVMGAGEAGYYTRENGPSGDDYTGLLAIPAGVLLVGVGLFTLWRSRKGGELDPPVRRRAACWRSRFLSASTSSLFPLAESYVITHGARVRARPRSSAPRTRRSSFTTSDGLRLEGWYVPSKNGAAVIAFPGRKGRRSPPGCSRVTATACCSSTGAARARAKAIRTLRLGGHARPEGGDLVPQSSAGRRRRPDRRGRALRRRRGAAPGGGRDRRPQGRSSPRAPASGRYARRSTSRARSD